MATGIVFIHGAGEGAYDEDAALVASLADQLGLPVDYPRMPDDDDWVPAIAAAVNAAASPVALVGHSAGGCQLLEYLASQAALPPIAAVCIIAAPFPGGDPDWTFDGFDLPVFSDRMPHPVFLYASEDDEVVPFAHRDLWAAAIPGSVTRTTVGGHQLGGDLSAVAADIATRG